MLLQEITSHCLFFQGDGRMISAKVYGCLVWACNTNVIFDTKKASKAPIKIFIIVKGE
jgi:hypothetical protein